jgi:hypothetical protein
VETFIAQDWITIQRAINPTMTTPITQGENGWLDLLGYQDVVVWLQASYSGGGENVAQITYQTSPTREDSMFADMARFQVIDLITITPLLQDAMQPGASPLSRWFRWQVGPESGEGWFLTFRLVVSANRIGRRLQQQTVDITQPFIIPPRFRSGPYVPIK